MSTLTAVTDRTFVAEVLESDVPVLVEFGAPWCGPCLMVQPALEQIARDNVGRVRVVTMDTDQNPVTAGRLQVMGLPTLQLYVNGEQVLNLVGAKPRTVLLKAMEPHL